MANNNVVYTANGTPLTMDYLRGNVNYGDWAYDASGNPTGGGFSTGSGSGTNWLGQGGYLQQGSQIASALGGLAQAYTGWQGLQHAKKAMQFEKDKYNRDLANQGLAYNTALEDRAKIAAVGGGLSEAQTSNKMKGLASKKMNTSAIG